MTFKEFSYECTTCNARVRRLRWDHEPVEPCDCGGTLIETSLVLLRNLGVIDDQLDGGARWCETLGHAPVWLDGTKSQWRQVMAQHGVDNVVRHDADYYRRQRRQHDERLADMKES